MGEYEIRRRIIQNCWSGGAYCQLIRIMSLPLEYWCQRGDLGGKNKKKCQSRKPEQMKMKTSSKNSFLRYIMNDITKKKTC